MRAKFEEYIVKSKKKDVDNTYILTLSPKNASKINFLPGQFLLVKNPKYKNPNELHSFSITSSPASKVIELCIKKYGSWTQSLDDVKRGDILMLNGPHGKFTFNSKLNNIVFLVGGIGIAPTMSMLRTIFEKNTSTSITLINGSRTPATIVYKKELANLTKKINLKIVHIFSHLEEQDRWKGYRGFITKDIIKKEIKLETDPTFFLVGPPIFVGKMGNALIALSVPKKNIRKELL